MDEFNEKVMGRYIPLIRKEVNSKFMEKVWEKKKFLKNKLKMSDSLRLQWKPVLEYAIENLPEIKQVCRKYGFSVEEVMNNNFEGKKISKIMSQKGDVLLARALYENVASTKNTMLLSLNPVDFFTISDTAPFKSCYSIGHTYHRSVSCLANDTVTMLLANINPEGKTVGKLWIHYYPEFDTAYAGTRKYGYVPDYVIDDVLKLLVHKENIINYPDVSQWVETSHNGKGKHIDMPSKVINFNPAIVGTQKYEKSLCVSCGEEYDYIYSTDDSRFAVCKDCWDFKLCGSCGEVLPCKCQQ